MFGEGCSSLRCEASRGAPRSPSTSACSPLTPSGEIPAARLVLLTVVCCRNSTAGEHQEHMFAQMFNRFEKKLIHKNS